jgi:hypothetical protein
MKAGNIFLFGLFLMILPICSLIASYDQVIWGFYGHKLINRQAIFTLPPDMIPFYKKHMEYIVENAVNPDRRRYAVDGEAPRHFIDLENYPDSPEDLPRRWEDAVARYSEDTLMAHGIAPWNVYRVTKQLTRAFENKDVKAILRFSTDLGHYIGDLNVPLHTTKNYNGQFTNQYGIHGFWESRLPELFAEGYNFFVGKAEYVPDLNAYIWEALIETNQALDSVLRFEAELTERFGEKRKWSFEDRGQVTMRVYSRNFSDAYHKMLAGQVEHRMRKSIKMVGDFWFTAWVDAGQPNLLELAGIEVSTSITAELEEEKRRWEKGGLSNVRAHDN